MAKRISKTRDQATTLFIILFALIAILGFTSILSPGDGDGADIQTVEGEPQLPTPSTAYSSYLMKVMAVTFLMIAALIVGLRVYRKQMHLRGKNNLKLNVLGKFYLNDKQYLMKVNIDDRDLLLGVSEQSINLITELSMDAEPEDPSFGHILDLETKESRPV